MHVINTSTFIGFKYTVNENEFKMSLYALLPFGATTVKP